MGDFSLNLNGIIAILAIITTITVAYFANWWRNRKSLVYEIESDTALFTAKEEVRDEMQIIYKGVSVKNARLFVLKILNNGNQSITSNDFEKPLSFVFSNNAQILSAEIITLNPKNLELTLDFQANRFSISPALLNSKDFIRIKAVVSGYVTEPKPDTRIIGVKAVELRRSANKRIKRLFWMVMLIACSLMVSGYTVVTSSPKESPETGSIIFFVGFILFVACCFYGRDNYPFSD